MDPGIVFGTLGLLIAAGGVGFNEWRSRQGLSTRYLVACVCAAMCGLAALAYCFSLGFVPGAVAVGAMLALSQQHRIENFLVRGRSDMIKLVERAEE